MRFSVVFWRFPCPSLLPGDFLIKNSPGPLLPVMTGMFRFGRNWPIQTEFGREKLI